MKLLILAVGLVLAVEGALYAIFPEASRKLMLQVLSAPPSRLRNGGVVALALGVGLIWLGRG